MFTFFSTHVDPKPLCQLAPQRIRVAQAGRRVEIKLALFQHEFRSEFVIVRTRPKHIICVNRTEGNLLLHPAHPRFDVYHSYLKFDGMLMLFYSFIRVRVGAKRECVFRINTWIVLLKRPSDVQRDGITVTQNDRIAFAQKRPHRSVFDRCSVSVQHLQDNLRRLSLADARLEYVIVEPYDVVSLSH